ncbi:MAG TPA: hypothetical protein VKE49_13065, partial [Myxococcaceae bacterium]|nr:hypothetical protein [Myxococcaceae bacterium]
MKRLEQERAELNSRMKAESDPIVRDRLGGALSFLDDELRERTRLVTAAARLQAEQARIYYALQNVYTHVVAVNSADAALKETAGDALKQSLTGLSEQVNAVAEALESVAALDFEPITPIAPTEQKAADPQRAPSQAQGRAAPVKDRG